MKRLSASELPPLSDRSPSMPTAAAWSWKSLCVIVPLSSTSMILKRPSISARVASVMAKPTPSSRVAAAALSQRAMEA